MEKFLPRPDVFDNIIYKRDNGFRLMSSVDFCPVNIIDDSYCFNFI